MNASIFVLLVITAIAAYTDIRYQLIPNKLTAAGLITGFFVNGITTGTSGIFTAAAGAAAGFGVMLLLYAIGAVGAGDVKLFAAIGACSGAALALSIMIYTFLFAGFIGLLILIIRKRLKSTSCSVLHVIAGVVIFRQFVHFTVPDKEKMIRFPLLLAVVPGVVAALWNMERYGGWLWIQSSMPA